jgi:hypothetical protein
LGLLPSGSLLVSVFLQMLIRHLPKPAQNVLVIESSFVEITGAAERNSAGVTEHFPLPLRCLYRERRTCAVNQFATYKAAVDKIERQCLETSDFGHMFPDNRKTAAYAR